MSEAGLSESSAILSSAFKGFTLVDLSQEIYSEMPVYDFFMPTQYFPVLTYEQMRVRSQGHWVATAFGLLMCDHSGTHVDSISHIDDMPGALTIDEFPLERFISDAVCLDVRHVQLPEFITSTVLREALGEANLDLEGVKTVLLYTGHYERHYPDIQYMSHHSGLDREAMEFLADEGVVNVGVDSPAIEHVGRMGNPDPSTMPAHAVCRERGMNNTENLANLHLIAGRRFIFIGLPLRLRGGSGSPIRAVALVPDS